MTYSVDYPEGPLNRWSTLARAVLAVPIVVLAAVLQSAELSRGSEDVSLSLAAVFSGIGGVSVPVVLMLLFRGKYPRWWFDWNLELFRFLSRILVYLALMTDRYPSTDERQSVHLEYPTLEAKELSRGLPLIKWFLAIPHFIVLAVLIVGAVFAVIGAWIAIVVTGQYPRALFEYVEGVMRWSHRVMAYSYTLVTDVYPPFTLSR